MALQQLKKYLTDAETNAIFSIFQMNLIFEI